MDGSPGDTANLIRKLSIRQWMVSLAVVVLSLGALFLGWRLLANSSEAAEIINLAGRQRMLSQRIPLNLALAQDKANAATRQAHLELAAAATAEFEQAHARLATIAAGRSAQSAIHDLYYGNGGVDAKSRAFVAAVRTQIALQSARPTGAAPTLEAIVATVDRGLLQDLQQATALFQYEAERIDTTLLRLLQFFTLLIAALVVVARYRVFEPVARRLADEVDAQDRTAREVKASEERFKAFSESLSDWFWQTDADDRFVWFQEGTGSRSPVDHALVLGRRRTDFLPEVERVDTEKWRRYQADIDARRPFRDFEYQIIGRGNELQWISVSGQPWFAEDGQFLGYRGTARNIQRQKEADAHRQRLLQAIEQSPASIAITDDHGVIVYVNASFSRISGYSAADAIGHTQALVRVGETPGEVFADMSRTLADGRTWRGEVSGRRKAGDRYWEDMTVSPVLDERGRATHYIAVSEDVTARKQAERREQQRSRILEAIASGSLPLPEVLGMIVAMAEAELPESTCSIQRLNAESRTLHNACPTRLPAAWLETIEGASIGADAGSCGTAAHTGKRAVVEDIATHPFWQAWRDEALRHGLRACWSQPVISSSGGVLGTLAVYYARPQAPASDEIRLIEMASSLAAICLERDEAMRQLREKEEETRRLLLEHETILANAVVGIVYLKHRRVISCNRRLEEIFGFGPGELIGRSSETFYDSHETFVAVGIDAYRAVAAGENYSTELMLRRRDGTLFRGALNGCALDPQHPQEGSIWVYADISERYRAEQEAHKLLQAVEQSPVSIVITNREGLIEYVNPRFTKATGFTADEAIGRNPRILQSGETPVEVYRAMWQTLLAGGEWRGVLRNRRKNGEMFWEEASMSPILDGSGRATHFLAVKEDITERKRIESELEQHRAHLEDLVSRRTADLSAALDAAKVADQAKDAFLAHVSHELRTPLNAVIGLSDLARRIGTDPRQRDYLEKVANAGKTLSGIINDLLDLSKISAGRMDLESITFSLRSLVQRSRSVMAHRAEEKGLRLTEEIDAAVPDVLVGDPLRIEQILLNLLSNAIKFTGAGRVELRIHADASEGKRIRFCIDVEDTGIGISPDGLERLFQPFAQADASMNRRFGGTGLGLALCKRLAELMDGDIRIESHVGVGTTVHVRIWLVLGDAATLPRERMSAKGVALPTRYVGARVLVADDQPINREIVEVLLGEVGIRAEHATTGKDVLDLLGAAGPDAFDLVLMDIQMPVVDGLAATRELRRKPGYDELPIVAMTAHVMEHEREACAAAGMNDHIGKPFETDDFFHLLAKWIPDKKHRYGSAAAAVLTPPPATLALAGIDTQAGLSRFSGNEERYRHWLGEFLAQAPGYAGQIREQLAAGDAEGARQLAHQIKGRAGMLGMTGLQPAAAALEEALRRGGTPDALLDDMQTRVDSLCTVIREAFTGHGSHDAQDAGTGVPEGTPPAAVANIIAMLRAADGESAAALESCIARGVDAAWGPALRSALASARRFDFEAALAALTGKPDIPTGLY